MNDNATWANAKYAVAGPFCEWLDDTFPGGHQGVMDEIRGSDRWERRYSEWRRRADGFINVTTTLDAFSNHIGIHLSEIPDHVFTNAPLRNRPGGLPMSTRRKLVQIAKAEGRVKAAEYAGVSLRTVAYHVERFGDAA